MAHSAQYSRRGFMLVEIMVAVAIIVLLAAMALPAFRQVQQSAVSERYMLHQRCVYTVSDAQLTDIDPTIDDGNFTNGLFRKIGSKAV